MARTRRNVSAKLPFCEIRILNISFSNYQRKLWDEMVAKHQRQFIRRNVNSALTATWTKIERSLQSRGFDGNMMLKCEVATGALKVAITLPKNVQNQNPTADERKMQLLSIRRSKYSVSVSACQGILAEQRFRRDAFATGRKLNLQYFLITSLFRDIDQMKGSTLDVQRLARFVNQKGKFPGNQIRLAIDSTPSRMFGRPATVAQICFIPKNGNRKEINEWPVALYLGEEKIDNYRYFMAGVLNELTRIANVEVWTIMDMASYTCLFPGFDFRSQNKPCFICSIDFNRCKTDYDFQKPWPKRDMTEDDVVAIPATRRLACMLHCGARVSEKIIDMLFNFLNTFGLEEDIDRARNFLNKNAKMRCDNGRWSISQINHYSLCEFIFKLDNTQFLHDDFQWERNWLNKETDRTTLRRWLELSNIAHSPSLSKLQLIELLLNNGLTPPEIRQSFYTPLADYQILIANFTKIFNYLFKGGVVPEHDSFLSLGSAFRRQHKSTTPYIHIIENHLIEFFSIPNIHAFNIGGGSIELSMKQVKTGRDRCVSRKNEATSLLSQQVEKLLSEEDIEILKQLQNG